MSVIMRAILQDHAPNTYYGHWLGLLLRESMPESEG